MSTLRLPSPVFEWADSERVVLTQPYSVSCSFGHFHLSPGLTSDGASIPRVFWRVVGPRLEGNTFPAALVHDALYQTHRTERVTADAVLYEVLRANGVGLVKASVIYRAVRAAGWAAWNEYSEQEQEYSRQFVQFDPREKGKV